MNNNPLKPIGLFHTPDCVAELEYYITKFSGSERVVAATVMGMTWNLCSKIMDEYLHALELEEKAEEALQDWSEGKTLEEELKEELEKNWEEKA